MRVHDVMSKAVTTIGADVTAAAAREKLRAASVSRLVVMHNEQVAGVVTAGALESADRDAPVREVMDRNVATIEPAATVRRAAGMLRGRGVDWLLVIDGAKPVGVITADDLLQAIAKGEVHAAPPSGRVVLRKRGPRKRAVPI